MRAIALGLVVTGLLLLPHSIRAADPPADVVFQADIEYGKVGEDSLKLNIAIPKNASGKLPVVLVIHGGAWRAGNRADHNDVTWLLAQKGYVSATIGYRFAPKFTFPAQIQDVKCAVRFLRANAEKYSIDVDRFGAVGFSAGAHLALLLGTMDPQDGLDDSGGTPGVSSKVQAVVSYFGPTDLELPVTALSSPLLTDFLGGPITEKRELYRRASPVTYVDKGDAPLLLLQGTNDPLVPHDQATRMADAMQKAGLPGRVELIVGGGHGNWGAAELSRAAAVTVAFFDQYLKTKPAAGPAAPARTMP